MIKLAFSFQIVGAVLLIVDSFKEIYFQIQQRRENKYDETTLVDASGEAFFVGNNNTDYILTLIKRSISILLILAGYLIMAYYELCSVVACVTILIIAIAIILIIKLLLKCIGNWINKKFPLKNQPKQDTL